MRKTRVTRSPGSKLAVEEDVIVGSAFAGQTSTSGRHLVSLGAASGVADCRVDSDDELWTFFETIPEANWYTNFVSRNGRQIRLVIARRSSHGGDPIPVGRAPNEDEIDEDGAILESGEDGPILSFGGLVYETATEMAGVEFLASIIDQPGMTEHIIQLLSVVGKGYWARVPGHDDADSFGFSIDDEKGEWGSYSTEDLRKNSQGKWEVCRSASDWKEISDTSTLWVIPFKKLHPRKRTKIFSSFMAARKTLRRIMKLEAAQSAIADARLAMRGLLVISADWEVDCPDDWDKETQGEWSFVKWLGEAIVAPITGSGTSRSAAPIIVEAPGDDISNSVLLVDFFTEFDSHLSSMVQLDTQRVTLAWDVASTLVTPTGVEDMNHWNMDGITESADTTTWRPMGQLIADTVTKYFLTPALQQEATRPERSVDDPTRPAIDIDEDEIAELCVIADTSAVMAKAIRSKDACAYHEKGLLSDEAAVSEGGFSPDQMPNEEEKLRSAIAGAFARTNDGQVMLRLLEAMIRMSGVDAEELGLGDLLASIAESTGQSTAASSANEEGADTDGSQNNAPARDDD